MSGGVLSSSFIHSFIPGAQDPRRSGSSSIQACTVLEIIAWFPKAISFGFISLIAVAKMESYSRPVRAGRLNSQQKLVAEGSCKPLKTSKVELKQKVVAAGSCKPEKTSKVELTTRQTRQSTSRKALSDLTNTGFSYQESSARARFNKPLEKPAANLLESFKGVVLDSVSKHTRGRINGSGVVAPSEDIGKKKHRGRVEEGIEHFRHNLVSEKLDAKLESIAQLDSTKNDGDNCNLKVSAIKMRRMERLERGTEEKGLGYDAVKLQSERGARRSQQPDKQTSFPVAITIEKKKPWNAGQYDGKGSVKVFGSDLKKDLTRSFHQSNRPKRRKDLVKDSQVAVLEGLHRVSYCGVEVKEEKGLGLTIPKKMNVEQFSKIVEQKPNTESNSVEARKVSVRRNNDRAARKVINYSECFDDFIIHKRSTVNMMKSDSQNVGNALNEAAQQMGTKRVKRNSDILHTERRKIEELEITSLERIEHKAVTATPVGSADQALEKYCEGQDMRMAPKQVPARRTARLPPKYGERSNTGLSHGLGCDPNGTVRKGNPSAKDNRKESPAICRKRNLSSDTTAFGEGIGAMGSENLSSMKLEVKCMDQNTQRGPKRGRKAPIDNNLERFTSAANVDVVDDMVPECFPVIMNDLSKILAEVPLEHQSSFDESQEGIEAATPDGTRVIISSLNDKTVSCRAIASFEDANLPSKVMDCCKHLGKPTLLQAYALPLLLAGHDIFCIAGPSSGQLYAHGIPAMVHMLTKKKSFSRTRPSPLCLVLTSSDELVQQITQAFEDTFGFLRMKIANLIDSDLAKAEKNILKPGKAILITTPESLQKALESGKCSLSNVSFLVLDRADTMLHCGSDSALLNILSQTPSSRQTAIFASMWLPELEELLKDAVLEANVVKIDVQDTGDVTVTMEKQGVSQTVEVLEETARDARLTALVQTYQKKRSNRVLVFALYKEEALHIQGLLHQRGWKVAAVHGGMLDSDRTHALFSFKKGSCLILVATDVAARRLEIPCVDYIINYSFPYTLDDYVFRMNQTGKAGRSGIVHTFFTPADQAHSQELIELLRESEQLVPEELLCLASPAFITRAK